MSDLLENVTLSGAAELLIADDDPFIRKAYRRLFEREGYRVRLARNGEEAVRLHSEKRPDLILLDVMMPKMTGLVACEQIRRTDLITPILFFTAMPSDVSLVRGFGCGGDDYIEKSSSPVSFLARVAAALRRVNSTLTAVRPERFLQLGRVVVDLDRLIVRLGSNKSNLLTRNEGILLSVLASRRGEYFSRERLFDAMRGVGMIGDTTQVRVYIRLLREKLGPAGDLIRNIPRVGYSLIV